MISFIRSLIFSLGMLIATFIYGVPSLFMSHLPFKFRYGYIQTWTRFILFWLRVTCGVRYKFEGLNNLPNEPVIIFSNHQSTWETFAFQALLPTHASVIKKELLRVPLFGWGLALLDPIAIDRKNKSAIHQLIKDGKACLEQGRWVVIFPEGTRHKKLHKFGPGGAVLASAAGHPVLPLAHNAGKHWPRKGFIKKPGTITIKIGPPISTTDKKSREINELAYAWISEALDEN